MMSSQCVCLCPKPPFLEVRAYVDGVGFVISEEDLASKSGTMLDRSELLCGIIFIEVKKDSEKSSDIDIRRGKESAPLASLIKDLYTFTRPTPTTCGSR